jgi:hypothetical protein
LRASPPAAALNSLLRDLNSLAPGITSSAALPGSASPQDIYNREREILDSYRLVPLVWIPQVYGLSPRVRNWIPPGPGQTWPLADVWLDNPDVDNKSSHIKDSE